MIPYAPLTEKQAEYIRKAQVSWLNVAEGGKRAGKNIINLIAWAAVLEEHPDKLHLAAGVNMAAAKMNILDSNGFGLESIFAGRCKYAQYKGKDALFVQTRTGTKIVIIAGGGKADDARRIKGNSYGTVYVTEVNDCHKSFVMECIDRTLASTKRQLFFDLNPKPPSHWFYAEFLDYQDELRARGENPLYNYGHFTILGNMSISDDQLRSELSKYNSSSLWYQADILGLRTSASGRIYQDYDRSRCSISRDEISKTKFVDIAIGVDVGGTDATCATLIGCTERWGKVVVMDGIHDKQGLSEKMTEAKYAKMLVQKIKVWLQAYPYINKLYVDSAAKLFRQALREELYAQHINRITVKAFDKSDGINARIELTCMLQMQGRFLIAEHLAPWHEAYQMAVWDEHAYTKGEWARLDNGSYPVDCLDSTEYGFYPFARYLETTGVSL
ncbi:MAG: terminase family protein [Clostridia bacterium]|nr:terminase family protein [Clostridia bacterium]